MQTNVDAHKKNRIQWEKEVGNWASKIAGYDVGEQKLEVRFAKEWDTFSKKNDMEAIKDLEDLKKFISFLSEKAQKFKVSKAATPRSHKSWREVAEISETTVEQRGRTGDIKQFARRLHQLGGRAFGRAGAGQTYAFTQPLGAGGRALLLVYVKDDVPTFTVGYIDGANDALGTAVTKYLIGEGRESRFRSELRYIAERGYAIYKNEALRVTESPPSEKGFFYYGAARYGDFVTQTTMVMPRVLSAALKEWIDEACNNWWSDASWDKVFDPDEMKGFGFAQWFRYWIEMSKKAELQIDNRTGTPGWAGWLRKTVTPKYMQEGGDRPKGTRPPGSKMMPYTGGKGGPRAWHSPLYARPFFIQDNWGKKQSAARERGDYAAYIKMQRELEAELPPEERTVGGPRWLEGMKMG